MNISLIINALRTKSPLLGQRVAGAADLTALLDNSAPAMAMPAAWVMPMDDSAESLSESGAYLALTERFAVIVMLDTTADMRGQAARIDVESMRLQLWKALLGWVPEDNCSPIHYEGGEVIRLDRGRLFYRYEFSLVTHIQDTAVSPISRPAHDQSVPGTPTTPTDTQGIGSFDKANINMDMIDPAADQNTPPVTDPNLGGYHGGYPGTDGRIEHKSTVTLPT